MESIIRNVAEIGPSERQVYETVLGHALEEDQQIIIRVSESQRPRENGDRHTSGNVPDQLPAWCRVFADLSDAEFSDLKSVIRRADLSRPS
jgi:hypothetical protein